MKTSRFGLCQGLVLLALFALASGHPLASEPAGQAQAHTQAPPHLAWDRVGSPIQMRA